MKKKLLSLTAVAIVTIGVAAYAIGYEKFKINDASDYVSEYVLEFDANTNKPTNLDSANKNGTYKAYTKDHNEITIEYENASANPNGYINLGQGGSILNPYIEGGYGNNRISDIVSIAVNFTGDLRLSLSAFGSVYGLTNVSLTSGEPYKVTDEILYSYFKLEASLHTSIQSMSIRYSCEYVDTVEFEFTKLDNGYELTHYNGDGGDVVIPDTYLGLPVISIGNSAFENCESLMSVTIPSSVTTIGDSAFYGCSNLTTITIPDGVTTIGNYAFRGCSSLTIYCEAASKPSGWSSSWNSSNCPVAWGYTGINGEYNGLEYAVCIDSEENKYITIIGYSGTDNDVTVPDTINVDGEVIKVTTIAENVFSNNDTIVSMTIGDNVTSIGSRAFRDCSNLTTVIFGENSQLTSIGSSAFQYCSSLISITIPNSVTTIGSYAFYNCSSLTLIIIPDSVTTIGDSAFYGCSNLTIYCEVASKPSGWSSSWNSSNCPIAWGYTGINGEYNGLEYAVSVDSEGNKYITIIGYSGTDNDVTVPDTINVDGEVIKVTTIAENVFSNNDTIVSMTIGDNVTTIGDSAFYGCSNLTTVTIGENSQLTSIGSSAFQYCSSLISITIPNSVTSIGSRAFSDCSNLTTIIIPDSVTTIGSRAFYNCSSLTIYCEAASKPSGWSSSSWNYSNCPVVWVGGDIIVNGDYAYVVRTSGEERYVEIVRYLGSGEEVVIPDTINVNGEEIPVTTIVSYAFYNCDSLTSITIPDSVTSIGDNAFFGCSNLTTVTFGENSQLTSIGSSAFYNCSSLTSIVIPNSVTSIGDGAFSDCSNLTTIIIPDSVTTIGDSAFSDCSNLTIYCEATSKPSGWYYYWNSSDCPVVWGYTGINGEYNGLEYAVSVDSEENKYITIIGYSGTDNDVTVPDTINVDGEEIKVTIIGERAFSGCSSLTSITIPDSVTSIGDNAFFGCSNLTTVTIGENSQLTSIGSSAFYNCSSLTSITIPDNVTTIGNYAFTDCYSLTSIIIPDSVTSIGDSAFSDCSNLTTVTFGENSQLTSIGSSAFYNCSSLTSITIPDNVTTIGYGAFSRCSSLTSIIIPDSVTTIGHYAFSGCSSLTICCEVASQPSGWSPYWNSSNRPVECGYTGE